MENIFAEIRHLADACRFAEEHINFLNAQREKIINLKGDALDCWLDESVLGNPQHLFIPKDVLIKELEQKRDLTKEELEIDKKELVKALEKFKELYESK